MDSSLSVIVGDYISIDSEIYQLDALSGQDATLSRPFSGNYTDIVNAYYVTKPNLPKLRYNAAYSDVDAYLEAQFSTLYPSQPDMFAVSRVTLDYGYSWLVTFRGELFMSDVEKLVVISTVNNPGMPSTVTSPFTTQGGLPTTLVQSSAVSVHRAGSLIPGVPVFIKVSAINSQGEGPALKCTVPVGESSDGSIVPRSPPGLPTGVSIYAVPTSTGNSFKVTWSEGELYGSNITFYSIEVFKILPSNTVSTQWVSLKNISAIANVKSYETFIDIDPDYNYYVRVRANNALGSSGPSWFARLDTVQFNYVSRQADFIAGAQIAIPACYEALDDCSEVDPNYRILSRGLPGAPSLYVDHAPETDVMCSFGTTWGMVYFSEPTVNGAHIDKWRVEWDTNSTFATKAKAVVTSKSYNISGLLMGQHYFVRVFAHNTGGYGQPSHSYPFKPHTQPDAPYQPALFVSKSSDSTTFATSLVVSLDYPKIDGPDKVGDGGDPVTDYYIEWSKIPFSQLTPTVQMITLTCENYDHVQSFSLSLTTANNNKLDNEQYYRAADSFVAGTYNTGRIYTNASAADVRTALQNLPNVGDITVTKTVTGTNPSAVVAWYVTFSEAGQVPLLQISSSSLSCVSATPLVISYSQNAQFASSSVYSWMKVPAPGVNRTSYQITNLISGQVYYVRVSAANRLGPGSKRNCAPASVTVPVIQPSLPTQVEGEWGQPAAFKVDENSVIVKVGSPKFGGGSLVTKYNLEWDTSSSFNSGFSGKALGSVSIPAYDVLCRNCVDQINFDYHNASVDVVVHYNGDQGTTRKLLTGERIIIVTTDDNIPYQFVVAASSTSPYFIKLQSRGIRQTTFASANMADLLLSRSQYEITGLVNGTKYYVRVSAENSNGVCTNDNVLLEGCGAFTNTSPSAVTMRQVLSSPLLSDAVLVNKTSVHLNWTHSSGAEAATAYRVDAFTRRSYALSQSFFDVSEVQLLSSSQVTGGSFTISFDSFTQNLGYASGFENDKCFNSSSDLTSLLEVGDQVFIDKKVYTVSSKYFTPLQFCVEESIASSAFAKSVSNAPILVRPKTNPIQWDVSAQKLKAILQNTPQFGQVKVERTLEGAGYAWTVTFMTNVGSQPNMVVNGLRLVGTPPSISVSEILNGIAPASLQTTYVNASSRATAYSALVSGLQPGVRWYFRVTTLDAVSNGQFSRTVSLMLGDVPTAPSK